MLTELLRPDALILDGMMELSKESSKLEVVMKERDELREMRATDEAQLRSQAASLKTLADSLTALDAERVALRNALDDANAKCEETMGLLRDTDEVRADLEDSLEKSIADRESLSTSLQLANEERDRTIAERDTILTSTSWRITGPLRKMSARLLRRPPAEPL